MANVPNLQFDFDAFQELIGPNGFNPANEGEVALQAAVEVYLENFYDDYPPPPQAGQDAIVALNNYLSQHPNLNSAHYNVVIEEIRNQTDPLPVPAVVPVVAPAAKRLPKKHTLKKSVKKPKVSRHKVGVSKKPKSQKVRKPKKPKKAKKAKKPKKTKSQKSQSNT